MQVKLNLIAAAAAAIFAGGVSAQDMVVKIGHVGPTSGGIAHLGKDNENGARMAIDELNAKGVTIGGKKVKFELLAEDDAADPKQGTAVAQQARRRQGQRRGRPPELGHLDSGVEDLQRCRHPADLAVGDQSRSTPARASRRRSASSPTTCIWAARSAATPSRS